MSISVMLADRRFSLDEKVLAAVAGRVLESESAFGKSMNIIYCSDRYIEALNKRFKRRKRVTDVLAFDLSDSVEPDFIGEVYVNLQQAKRQAKESRIPYEEEVKRLTIHGVLHLLGYRDLRKSDRENMWARQEGYL
jgi:probable rRNA maturation factor